MSKPTSVDKLQHQDEARRLIRDEGAWQQDGGKMSSLQVEHPGLAQAIQSELGKHVVGYRATVIPLEEGLVVTAKNNVLGEVRRKLANEKSF